MPMILYGGTFDPVHNGHVAIASAVAAALGSAVRLLPAADPPHRPPPGASAAQRLEMLELAIAGEASLSIDGRELLRSGPSFTVDTLAQVREEIGPMRPLVWVVGLDSMAELSAWHQWRKLFSLTHILGVERPGTRVDEPWLEHENLEVHAEILPRLTRVDQLLDSAGGFYAVLPMRPLRQESATEVRWRIARGEPWRHLVPVAVADYIDAAGLYRSA